jgi:hypothetical protein
MYPDVNNGAPIWCNLGDKRELTASAERLINCVGAKLAANQLCLYVYKNCGGGNRTGFKYLTSYAFEFGQDIVWMEKDVRRALRTCLSNAKSVYENFTKGANPDDDLPF